MKVFLAVLALSVAPAIAFAECGHDKQATTCKPGTSWDADQSICVSDATT